MKLFCVKNEVKNRVYFISRVFAEPPLMVRHGEILNYFNHYYLIDCGGREVKRNEEEVFFNEDEAWNRLNNAFGTWLELYS